MNTQDVIGTLSHRDSDAELKIVEWARDLGIAGEQLLGVAMGLRPTRLAYSNATGEALVSNGFLGADIIRLSAGDGFVPHTHPGDHLLIVVAGLGTITYGGKIYSTRAGNIFMVEGQIPHAIGAITDHVILAVGSQHKPIDSADRMTPVDYEAVTTDINELHCLICDIHAQYPQRLHDAACPHCPCFDCHPYGLPDESGRTPEDQLGPDTLWQDKVRRRPTNDGEITGASLGSIGG